MSIIMKRFITFFIVLLSTIELRVNHAHSNTLRTSFQKIEYYPDQEINIDRRPDTDNILKTPFSKIEYLISQATGIGYGRPGTEEFLNAEILVKFKDDTNLYGLSLIFSDKHGHGTNKAMFDTLLSALIHDLKVQILYYKKDGVKQIVRITVKK